MSNQLHPRAIWLFFARFFLMELAFIFWFGLLFLSVFMKEIFFNIYVDMLGLLFLGLLVLFNYMWAELSYRFYRYELTEDAYKSERGVIWKKYVSIPYGQIQNVDIYRGVIARLLGLSDLQIQTAGYGGGRGREGFGFASEGRLPGLSKEDAEKLRDELIHRAKKARNQGL